MTAVLVCALNSIVECVVKVLFQVIYVFMGSVAGYVSAWMYKSKSSCCCNVNIVGFVV